jgi:rod shape determining protein RodA
MQREMLYGREFTSERRPIRHLDGVLLASVLTLAVIGLFMVYSATNRTLADLGLDPGTYIKKQMTWTVLGLVLLLITASFDYRFVKVYAGFIYGAMLIMLVLVRTPLGSTVKGSQRWFEFLGFQFTPSEWMKIGLIVMLAAYLSELRHTDLSLQETVRVIALGAFPMALVFLQPDVGTTIVLAVITVGVLIVAGAKPRHLAVIGLAGLILLFAAFQVGVVKQYQIDRLVGFMDNSADPQSAGYNKAQAEIAIGSGGVLGLGYRQGTQTNLDFVPEQHTDFIFTAVGEEFGFVGAVVVLLLFAVVIWRAFRIALLSKDPFGTYLAAGIASMFAIQVFVNIGMTIGIMPITGIPLPFVSYGGTSTLANFVAVGLLLNVHMRRFK